LWLYAYDLHIVELKGGLDPPQADVNRGAIGALPSLYRGEVDADPLNELKHCHRRYGMVTMCVGGDISGARILENQN
jgi:hypothetical protein